VAYFFGPPCMMSVLAAERCNYSVYMSKRIFQMEIM